MLLNMARKLVWVPYDDFYTSVDIQHSSFEIKEKIMIVMLLYFHFALHRKWSGHSKSLLFTLHKASLSILCSVWVLDSKGVVFKNGIVIFNTWV